MSTSACSAECDHAPAADPRKEGACCKCGKPLPAVPKLGGRNAAFERDFINLARRRAGIGEDWEDDVKDRMLAMERSKGTDSYLEHSLRRMVNEADCEGLDLAGWPLLAALMAYRDIEDPDARAVFHELMLCLAVEGARVRWLCAQALDLIG